MILGVDPEEGLSDTSVLHVLQPSSFGQAVEPQCTWFCRAPWWYWGKGGPAPWLSAPIGSSPRT